MAGLGYDDDGSCVFDGVCDDECINPSTTWQRINRSGLSKELVRDLRNSNDSPRFVVVVSQLVGPVPGVPRAPAGRREVPLAAPAAGGHPSSGGLHERLEVGWVREIVTREELKLEPILILG